jgi:hypothetical protein
LNVGRRSVFAVLVLALSCGPVAAAPQDREMRSVRINAVRDPEMKSYRAVVAGLDVFDQFHMQLAPGAPGLRFRVIEGSDRPAAEQALALRIASDDDSFPVPIGADGYFSVPRSQAASASRADLVFNRKKDSFRVKPDIRTAGLPANVRRLGDLRLECKVMVAIAKEEIPFWMKATVNTLLMTTDWCGARASDEYISFGYRAAAPLAGAMLRNGERTQPVEFNDSSYQVRIGDPSWPDDTLIELRYEAQASPVAKPAD